MTGARAALAAAGVLTALLLQATVIGPVTSPWPVSLGAVLVAVVAMVDGPAAGMSLGFAAGLLADLGSAHPAGVLALCWLGLGLVTGLVGDRGRWWWDSLTVGVLCGVAASVATVMLTVVHDADALGALTWFVPSVLGDTLLASMLLPLVRRLLHTDHLRAPRPVGARVVLSRPAADKITSDRFVRGGVTSGRLASDGNTSDGLTSDGLTSDGLTSDGKGTGRG